MCEMRGAVRHNRAVGKDVAAYCKWRSDGAVTMSGCESVSDHEWP